MKVKLSLCNDEGILQSGVIPALMLNLAAQWDESSA